MFIQTEATPNPMSLKFIPGQPVMPSGTAEFQSAADATRSPLAQNLFALDGVTSVFFGEDFVTVTKDDDTDWAILKTEVLTTIMDHYVAGKPIIGEGTVEDAPHHDEDDEIGQQIREIIETRVRPAVAQDGGDIIYRGFEDGIVKLQLRGACSGCPSSTATLKHGIENMLKHYIPEVEGVEAVAA